jgi:hypothetical protein
VYERKRDKQMFYFIPVESILGKLPVVPIGDTGSVGHHSVCIASNARDFVDAAFDTKEGLGEGTRCWCINTWTLSLSRERFEK